MLIKGKDFIIQSTGVYYRYPIMENRSGSLVVMDINGEPFERLEISKEKADSIMSRISYILENVPNPNNHLINLEDLVDNA